MPGYRHLLSAIAFITCFATTIAAAPTPTVAPSAVSSPTVSPTKSPSAATPSPKASIAAPLAEATVTSQPTPVAAVSPAAPVSGRVSVISYLSEVIAWFRIVALEEQTASDPADILYISDSRQMAQAVLHLAFDYARAQAALNKATAAEHPETVDASETASRELLARRRAAQGTVNALTAKIAELKAHLRGAAASARDPINRELAATQGQLDLAQSHVDSLDALIDYENGSAAGDTSRNSLEAQIDELESSLPHEGQGKSSGAQVLDGSATNTSLPPNAGFLTRGEFLITLQGRQQALDAAIKLTSDIVKVATTQREHLVQSLSEIDAQSVQEAHEATSSNIATVRETQDAFRQLAARRKLVTDAMQPLSKQIVTLNLYGTNLERWRSANSRRFRTEVRNLVLRAAFLAVLIGIVSLAAIAWRKLAFHYVPDLHRRYQLMQLRRFAIGIVIVLILLFGLGGDLRVLATVMGFAAAGIALALQNVILSFAGYFYIGGRFGIRVGDRIQLGGIAGDVLEIGLFKLTLMELNNDTNGRQPTGRIVVFPNSIVFQPNGNFFNQLPGSNYTWNELRLTLAPDCDYRLAEQRLMEVVGAVFGRFRDSIQRDYHNVESNLNLRFESPRPQSRLQFNDAGIEVVVRYPVPLLATAQAADEIARRLIDAINREPGLRLVPQSNPALQRMTESSDGVAAPSATPASASIGDANAGITPAASAVAGAVGMAAASAVVEAASPPASPAPEPPKR
jgi:small-conductance mechanosensitive channel